MCGSSAAAWFGCLVGAGSACLPFVWGLVSGEEPTAAAPLQAANDTTCRYHAHTCPQILAGNKSLPRTLGGGDVLAPAAVRQQYQRRTSLGGGGGEGEAGAPLRRALDGADCPICFDVRAGWGQQYVLQQQ